MTGGECPTCLIQRTTDAQREAIETTASTAHTVEFAVKRRMFIHKKPLFFIL